MIKYLLLIKESRESRGLVTEYLKNNKINFNKFEIINREVKIEMGSADRFAFEFVKFEFEEFIKKHNLKLSKMNK
jgi:hypothetical protein